MTIVKSETLAEVYLLLKVGGDVRATDRDGFTALYWTAKFGDGPKILQLFLDMKLNVDMKDAKGKTP
tara:strand:- start:130 stop:330 length:201 start_codon:yes stop_codon:yes gene_type:complete